MAAFIPAAINAAATIGSAVLNRGQSQETKIQRKQRKLIDKMLSSLEGNGPYADLYNFDENTYQKSFVEPALAQYRNQIAPQIQQQFIAGGQQRGTGLDDQLLRAGIDLDAMLNQYMFQAQEGAQNRKQNALSGILGAGSGGTSGQSVGQAAQQGAAGYLSSDAFTDTLKSFMPNKEANAPAPNIFSTPPRKGFTQDFRDVSFLNQ